MADPAGARSEDLAGGLGPEIRQLRRAKGLTLAVLAKRIGKSIGFLSQVERDLTKPSIGTLQDISEALGVHIGWFFQAEAGADPRERPFVVRAGARRRLAYTGLGSTDYLRMTDYLLSASLEGRLALVMTRYAPGASSGDEMDSHEGEEAGFVHSGTLRIELGGDAFTLLPGDSFSFRSDIPHRYSNPGEEETVVIFAITPVILHY